MLQTATNTQTCWKFIKKTVKVFSTTAEQDVDTLVSHEVIEVRWKVIRNDPSASDLLILVAFFGLGWLGLDKRLVTVRIRSDSIPSPSQKKGLQCVQQSLCAEAWWQSITWTDETWVANCGNERLKDEFSAIVRWRFHCRSVYLKGSSLICCQYLQPVRVSESHFPNAAHMLSNWWCLYLRGFSEAAAHWALSVTVPLPNLRFYG